MIKTILKEVLLKPLFYGFCIMCGFIPFKIVDIIMSLSYPRGEKINVSITLGIDSRSLMI